MPREIGIRSCTKEDGITLEDGLDDSPPPKRAYGNKHRAKVLVLSDSDSDSDLPLPVSLLRQRNNAPVALHTKPKCPPLEVEVIDISSDSAEDCTPTKPRTNKPPLGNGQSIKATRPEATPVCSVSTSLSRTLERVKLTDTTAHAGSRLPESDLLSLAEEPNSSDTSDSEDNNVFDEDSCQPGLIKFDNGSRRPQLAVSGSTTSISTVHTSSQSSWGNDDPFDNAQLPGGKTGNAKAGTSGARSRVKESNPDGSTAPETPQLKRPKPKPRPVALASASTPVSLSPKPTPRNHAKVLEGQAVALFLDLNQHVFGDRLPKDCPIKWSKKLNTTAGRAHWKRIRDADGNVVRHECHIELSTKVVDCEERVKNTLSHEMCHLAAWICDGETSKAHGPKFKDWSNRVMKARPDIAITTCHSYEIAYKYEWKCSSEDCGRTYGRHSKSIDPAKQVCGGCRGHLTPLFTTTPRRNAFQEYLKIHMKDFKAANPGMQHGETMKRLGEMFRAEKEAAVDAELDQVMAGMTKLALNVSIA